MSDWELVDFNKTAPDIKNNVSEWEIYVSPEEKQKENILKSLLMSPFRIGEDILRAGYGTVQNIPRYLEAAKTEIPGLYETWKEHPKHLGMQALAGSQEAINKLAQLPLNLSKYGEERLNLIPEGVTKAISSFTPEDTTESISRIFGEPIHPGESFLRGTIRNIPELSAVGKVGSFARGLTDKGIINDVLNTKYGNIEKYSGPQGKYSDFFQRATAQGARPDINVDLNKINFKSLGEKQIKNNYEGIEKLRSSNNLQLDDYQSAVKELGIIERGLKKRKEREGTLTDKLDARYHEAKKVKKYIQDNMLKDEFGKNIKKLLPEYKKIQKGYASEVLPYTKNKSISAFEAGEIKQNELINALRKSPFSAQRGKHHGIETRDKLKKAAAISIGLGSLGALYEHGGPLASALIRALNEQK